MHSRAKELRVVKIKGNFRASCGSFRRQGVPYFKVFIIGILLF